MNNKFTEPNVELMNFFCEGLVSDGEYDTGDVSGVGKPSITDSLD